MNETVKSALIEGGVKNLREFGYPSCTKDNILTDQIYSAFFDRMLEDHHGHAAEVADLRATIAKSQQADKPAKAPRKRA